MGSELESILENDGIIWTFRPVNERSLSLIIHNSLWASSPDYFNDPFESNRQVDDVVRVLLAAENINKESSYYEDVKEHLEYALDPRPGAYVCFCGSASETLMWSHYANEHKGIAIGFKRSSTFSITNETSLKDNALVEIHYGTEVFENLVKKAIRISKEYYSHNGWADSSNEISKMLDDAWKAVEQAYHFTKAECWKYEREVRLDAGVSKKAERGLYSAADPKKGYSVRFEPSDVVAIIFGVNCHRKKINTIETIIQNKGRSWAHVKLLQARRWDFGLRIIAS